jgi:uridine phosphorylase
MDLKRMFGDVKFVCMGGSAQRMQALAERIRQSLDIELPGNEQV